MCELGSRRLDEVAVWLDAYRQMLDERMDRLAELVNEHTSEQQDDK